MSRHASPGLLAAAALEQGGADVAIADRPADASQAARTKTQRVHDAYLEYCKECEQGEVDPVQFCGRYPSLQSSLGNMLFAHQFLHDRPDLLGEEPEVRWPETGETFLDYELVLQLGMGAFARVFLARETKLGNRLVAVKIAQQGGAAEAETLGRIQHPHVVPVHSVHRDPESGLSLVCMPYAGSATLHDVFDLLQIRSPRKTDAQIFLEAARDLAHPVDPSGERAAPPRALESGTYVDGVRWMGLKIAQALAYIHEQGICHLDLKPSNVLLSPEGKPMLLDFNLSSDALRERCDLGGTFPYMSPEQLRYVLKVGEKTAIGPRSDLFSFGVIFYELASGAHPFGPFPRKLPAADLARWILDRQAHAVKPVRKLNPDVDPELARLIESCLQINPAERPQAAAGVAANLEKQVRLPAQTRRWFARNPRKVLAGALLGMALFAAAATPIALMPPASERHYVAGTQLYHEGKYLEAIQRFSHVIELDPTNAAAYFARGRANQKLGLTDAAKFSHSIADFGMAQKLEPSGKTMAAMAYSSQMSSSPQHGAALLYYRKAVETGFVNAEVLNNMGFCVFRSTGKIDDARVFFDKAISLGPPLQAAHHNRGVLNLNVAANLASKIEWIKGLPNGKPAETDIQRLRAVLQDTKKDLDNALELGPPSGELLYHAAGLYAGLSRNDVRHKEAALEHLANAIKRHGLNPKDLAKDPLFNPLKDDSRFEDLTKLEFVERSTRFAQRFVDPIKD